MTDERVEVPLPGAVLPPELLDSDWARSDRAVLNIGEDRTQEDRLREAP